MLPLLTTNPSVIYVIRDYVPLSDTDTTESLQPADENLEILLCAPLFCEQYCSLPTLAPSRNGQMRDQAVFAATLLSLFSLGQHLSVGVNQSEVMHRFLSEVFNFKT